MNPNLLASLRFGAVHLNQLIPNKRLYDKDCDYELIVTEGPDKSPTSGRHFITGFKIKPEYLTRMQPLFDVDADGFTDRFEDRGMGDLEQIKAEVAEAVARKEALKKQTSGPLLQQLGYRFLSIIRPLGERLRALVPVKLPESKGQGDTEPVT